MNKKRYIKSYSCLVHNRPYQGVKSGKQVASCTKWGLGDNVVLQLVEYLTPTVNCHLTVGVNNMRASGVFNKNRLRKYTIIGDKQLQKMERGHFEKRSTHQAKTLCNLQGWLEQQQGALHSFF